MHGGASPVAPKGNRNALKQGRYTGEASAEQRELAALICTLKGLSGQVKERD